MYCDYCHSENLVFLGTLGFRDHYRCRDCGSNVTDMVSSEDDDVREMEFDDDY